MTNEIGLIEYFMAHAPLEPQEWHTRNFPKLEMEYPDDEKEFIDFYNECAFSPSPTLAIKNKEKFAKCREIYDLRRGILKIRQDDQNKEIRCSWPLAWAKEMAKRAIGNNGRI
jgi:hypothetical protein